MGNSQSYNKYGWKKDQPDHRDKYHFFEDSEKIPQPGGTTNKEEEVVDLRDNCPPVYNQGSLGSSTANAISAAFEYDQLKQKLANFTPSRLFIYYNERVRAGHIDEDSGTEIREGMKSINSQGVCTEEDWPYDINEFTIEPTEECYQNAKKHR